MWTEGDAVSDIIASDGPGVPRDANENDDFDAEGTDMVVDVAELAEQVKVTAKTRDELEAMRKPVAVRVLAGSTGRERGAVAHGTVERGAWNGDSDVLIVTLVGQPHEGVQQEVHRTRLEPMIDADRRERAGHVADVKPDGSVVVDRSVGPFATRSDLELLQDVMRDAASQIESLQHAVAAIERRQMPLITGDITGPRTAQIPNLGTWVPQGKLDAAVKALEATQRDIATVIASFRHDHNPKIVADAIIALGDVMTKISEHLAEARRG